MGNCMDYGNLLFGSFFEEKLKIVNIYRHPLNFVSVGFPLFQFKYGNTDPYSVFGHGV